MKKINCISGHEGDGVEAVINLTLDCVNLRVDEGDKINMVMLGKKEVQELINQLEELKKDIL